MRYYHTIATAERRIKLARMIAEELSGDRPRNGLRVRKIGEYTIVDDGQDRWIDSTENYDETVESFIEGVINGECYENCDEYDYAELDWYSDFCMANSCIYSRIGQPSDEEQLIDRLNVDGCDIPTLLEIIDELAIGDEPLPAMILAVHSHGERFHGGKPIDIALEWIEHGFDSDTASQWMDVGFWEPSTADACRAAGIDAEGAEVAAKYLVEKCGEENPYTDGCPIYSACNGDTDVIILVDALEEIE